ncbi:MAG: hypothetical protein HKO95_14895 [Rhodobacteraceae bacterium]|nr:hypothetical protein [Alphaproteobacteria bacterium]MBT8477039.1 hypothetical protein [Alphaproteobacteria bacterium]NNK68010.1 hypothetical protein [Paracoccaceae bacterium]
MTAMAARGGLLALPGRLLGLVRVLAVGTLLCLSPLTSLIALGWLTRVMGATIARRSGGEAEPVGWILGPRGQGAVTRLAGGLGANIRAGVLTAAGLALWTLPFTVAWLGAWWAGWENSFNKGYEQAAVGPLVWLVATVVAVPVLAHLPFALAHWAAERRMAAFFELRRIRAVFAAAGWRAVWLAFLSALAVVPFFGLRGLPVFVEGYVPGFAGMSPEEQAQVAQGFDLLGAAVAFGALFFLRQRAAAIYARAVTRATAPSRIGRVLWFGLASLLWLVLPVAIVFGQFLNYDPVLWLTHPLFLLPWAG